jgi:hypothetical protein
MSRLLALSTVCLILAGCGDEGGDSNPMSSNHELVGTWTFENTNFESLLADGAADMLRDLGYSEFDIQIRIQGLKDGFNDSSLINELWQIRFGKGGAYDTNEGEEGTWTVDGNQVRIVAEEVDTWRYFIGGDKLTLSMPWPDAERQLRRDADEFDADIWELLSAIFSYIDDEERLTFVFTRS